MRIASILAWALALSVPAVAAQPVIVRLDQTSPQTTRTLRQAPGVTWWAEFGDWLVLVGDTPRLLARGDLPTLQVLDDVDPARLFVHADGCAHGPAGAHREIGRALARVGHWELRALRDGETIPADDTGHWRPLPRNQVTIQRYRPDATAAPVDPLVAPMVEAIDAERWYADVQTLSGWDRNSFGSGILAARDWLAGQFAAIGLEVSQPAFTLQGRTLNNVIGTWTGTAEPERWVVVGGHYDAIGSGFAPGADDNASGCAGVLELARAVTAFRPRRTVIFMCYSGEEQGMHGSAAHVSALRAAGDLGKVGAMINMDMIGYSRDGQLDVLLETTVSNRSYIERFAAVAATYAPELGTLLSTNPFGSDHLPYLQAGVRALLTIQGDDTNYPHYHASSDTPLNMDNGGWSRPIGGAILRMNAAMLAELAGASDRIFGAGFDAGGSGAGNDD